MSHLKDCICGYRPGPNSGGNLSRHRKKCKEFKVFVKSTTPNIYLQQQIDQQNIKIAQMEKSKKQCYEEQIAQKNSKIAELEEIIRKLQEELNLKYGNSGYNYIIQTRESQRMKENVYKIGRTKCIQKRFKQYPKGSKLIYSRKSSDDKMSECLLKRNFANIFRQRKDYGSEYFEGEIQNMKTEF